MKCKRPGCPSDAAVGQVYCCASCAPFGNYGQRGATPSALTGASSHVEDGVRYRSLYDGVKRPLHGSLAPNTEAALAALRVHRNEPAIAETPKPSSSERSSSMPSKPKENEAMRTVSERIEEDGARHGRASIRGSGTAETSRETEDESESAEQNENLPAASSQPSLLSDVENSPSILLIDESVQHLHGLMTSVARVPDDPEDVNTHLDPQKVGAACNCAKNIVQLLRLKVEMVKLAIEMTATEEER